MLPLQKLPSRYRDPVYIELLQQTRDQHSRKLYPESVVVSNDGRESIFATQSGTASKQGSHDELYRTENPETHKYQTTGFFGPRRPNGWRMGVTASLIGVVAVFLCNIATTIWVWKRPNSTIQDSMGVLFQGDCARARSLNVWIHFVVNAFSTLLLAASNFCLQVLSAPSPKDLARAHEKRQWLQIGLPSLRNLWRIGKNRTFLCVVLLLSSVPLHLLFNSVVFMALQANEYAVVPSTEDWLYGAEYDYSSFIESASNISNIAKSIDSFRPGLEDSIVSSGDQTMSRYANVSTTECFNRYNDHYLSSIGNVYLVQDGPTVWRNTSWYPEPNHYTLYPQTSDQAIQRPLWITFNEPPPWTEAEESLWGRYNKTIDAWEYSQNSSGVVKVLDDHRPSTIPFIGSPERYPSNGWRCASHLIDRCDTSNEVEVALDRSKWAPYEREIRYCMIEQVEESCMLYFSFPIAIAVIVSNLLKLVCMGMLVFQYRKHEAIITVGDAVSHYLGQPDPTTRGRCMQTRERLQTEWFWESAHGIQKDETDIKPEKFVPKRSKWTNATPPGRWYLTYSVYVIAVLAGIVLSVVSMKGMPQNVAALWRVGFGVVQNNNLLKLRMSLMRAVLTANSPQMVLSYLYIAFNALYTSMLAEKEWTSYVTKRKALRVSSPQGCQRSTYWLNVPFRYVVPMTGASVALHWLASQSLFMVNIRITGASAGPRTFTSRISTCGYSPMAIVLTNVLGGLMIAGGLVLGNLRFPAGVPVAGTCSAIISAACHGPPEERDAALFPVQWGVVAGEEQVTAEGEVVRHCGFSSGPVEFPAVGRLYK